MILLMLNCRGAASNNFLIAFKDSVAFHRPYLVILSETKIAGSRVDSILSKLGFSHFIKSNAKGLYGGLEILWQDSIWLQVVSTSPQEIHFRVQVSDSSPSFLCSTIYSKPYSHDFCTLWNNLTNIARTHSSPWLIGGDFNRITTPSKRVVTLLVYTL